MARLFFTQQLARFTTVREVDTLARHLRAALDTAFAAKSTLLGYVLNEQGHLRANVVTACFG